MQKNFLPDVSTMNGCFSMRNQLTCTLHSVNHDIYCVSPLHWLLGSLEPKLWTISSKYTQFGTSYSLFFLLLNILTYLFSYLVKCTYLHMLVDIYLE